MLWFRLFDYRYSPFILFLLIFQSSYAGEGVWTSLGPANTVVNDLVLTQQPNTLYIATANNGIYRSRDAGANWEILNNGLTDLQVRTLAVSPRDDAVLYAGTATSGVFKSTDRGETWIAVNNGLTDQDIYHLHFGSAGGLFQQPPLFAGSGIRLFRSVDEGESWVQLQPLPRGTYATLAINPRDEDMLIVAATDVYKSLDKGNTWQSSSSGFPGQGANDLLFPRAADTSGRVLAATNQGVYQSTDAGTSWDKILELPETNFALASPPKRLDTVTGNIYVSTVDGVYQNAPDNWQLLAEGAENLPFQALLVDESKNLLGTETTHTLYAGSSGGGVYTYTQVRSSGRNTAPVLPEVPDQTVVIGDTLVLQVTATDAQDNPFKYELFRQPEGAKINSETGQFLWATSRDRHRTGRNTITILAKEQDGDPNNLIGIAKFTVTLISPKLADFALKKEELDKLDAEKVSKLDPEAFTAFLPEYVQLFTADAFAGLSPKHIEKMPRDALRAMTLNQFSNLSDDALTGINKRNISGLPPDVINAMTLKKLAKLQKEEFKQLPGELVAQFLTNLNPDQIKPKDIQDFLPDNWQVDETTGRLQPPIGSRLNFRCLPLAGAVPDMVSFPSDRPDFNTGFSVGGTVAERTVLQELNDSLFEAGLATFGMRQQVDGVLRISGTAENMGTELALLADVNNMYQISETAEPQVSLTDTGHYVVTTEAGQELRLVPAPKDVTAFYEIAGGGEVKIGDDGSLLIIPPATGTRRNTTVYRVIIFDPFLEQAPPDTPAGIYDEQVVYTDGMAQNITATVLSPQTFVAAAYEYEGVENILYNIDGSFSISYLAQLLRVTASPDVTILPVNNQAPPTIVLNPDGTLLYNIQDSQDIVQTLMFIGLP